MAQTLYSLSKLIRFLVQAIVSAANPQSHASAFHWFSFTPMMSAYWSLRIAFSIFGISHVTSNICMFSILSAFLFVMCTKSALKLAGWTLFLLFSYHSIAYMQPDQSVVSRGLPDFARGSAAFGPLRHEAEFLHRFPNCLITLLVLL